MSSADISVYIAYNPFILSRAFMLVKEYYYALTSSVYVWTWTVWIWTWTV
jgi:hypothetical protein